MHGTLFWGLIKYRESSQPVLLFLLLFDLCSDARVSTFVVRWIAWFDIVMINKGNDSFDMIKTHAWIASFNMITRDKRIGWFDMITYVHVRTCMGRFSRVLENSLNIHENYRNN